MLDNMNTKTSSQMSALPRCHGAAKYHTHTPLMAMMYELDSLPVLKSTVKSKTEASKVMRKPSLRHCLMRR